MNNIKLLVFACILTFTISCSQQKRYVTYKVKRGETMKDIATRLNIPAKDLLRLNPDVSTSPNANTLIIIPNPKVKYVSPVVKPVPEIADRVIETDTLTNTTITDVNDLNIDSTQVVKMTYEYVTHTVKPKETVYALTKLYGITKDELIQLNPEFPGIKNNNLSIGQIVKVKSIATQSYISLEEDLKNHVTHLVKPKETVYALTRFYNITKDQLIRLNPEYPGLKDNELTIGQVLRIRNIVEKVSSDDKEFYEDVIQEDVAINLAILLPFKLEEYRNQTSQEIFEGNKLTNMVTDFYMGAQIAIDSLVQQGVVINTSILDTGNRGENVPEIISSNALDDMDVVIGPFYSDKAELVANKVRSNVVFPHFSKNQKDFTSSRLVKAEPDLSTHADHLSTYLKENYSNETIFIVGDIASEPIVKSLVKSLKEHDSISDIHVLKPEEGYIKKERFTDKMTENSHSWVIMTSEDNVVVADALNSMVVLPENVTAQVFAIEKNSAYDQVDNNKLARIKFSYVTNTFDDIHDANTKAFNKKYRAKNFAMPSQYSIKGFDVTYDVLVRLASGDVLTNTFKKGTSIRLESKFDYDKKMFGTANNYGLFIVKYNEDLSLERLK